MPTSRHSSSSRSSSSRSSGSRSSSSRSASSFRSSSRSSSSGSSSYTRSSSSSSRGPSRHSSSSRSSVPRVDSSTVQQSYRQVNPAAPPRRPRVNQPIGFLLSGALKPSYHYGKLHDYVYYPESWTDQNSGRTYEKGYYDENGNYYANVVFARNGRYENIVCSCPYCGQDTILNLTAEDVASHHLQCPHCGGPMEVQTELDEYLGQTAENTHIYASEESLRQFTDKAKKKKRRKWWLIAIVVLILLVVGQGSESIPDSLSQNHEVSYIGDTSHNISSYGDILLTSRGQNSYFIAGEGTETYDKRLTWDSDAESYYDAESGCWLWYNIDVEPPLWQYWYEGISSDFGDYGWMEHDLSGWYIEQSEGNWISLPDQYDSGSLWYIEDSIS